VISERRRHQWIVTQIGARELYAVPRALHRRGSLDRLYTDVWCRYGAGVLTRLPGRLGALGGRHHKDLPAEKVFAFSARSLWRELTSKAPMTHEEQFALFADLGGRFAGLVRRALEGIELDPKSHRFFGFDTGVLETLEFTHERGVFSVVDQIDLARIDEDVSAAEADKWPGWQRLPGRAPKAYFDRLAQEWSLADLVVANSSWSQRGLVRLGVPEKKIAIIPLAYESGAPPGSTKPVNRDRPLTVLFLGQVILRKGFPYLVEAARRLTGTTIRFVVAGPLGIAPEAVALLPSNMSLLGRVLRPHARRLYSQADVFVLPTLSDGFAITQLEAMSHGLPVIATPNCGEVVKNEYNGLIVPPGDASLLAEAIARLDRDRVLLAFLSVNAAARPADFTLDAYADRLEEAVGRWT
jgi:glycosyltransferase involved in cell wall biosynthesis